MRIAWCSSVGLQKAVSPIRPKIRHRGRRSSGICQPQLTIPGKINHFMQAYRNVTPLRLLITILLYFFMTILRRPLGKMCHAILQFLKFDTSAALLEPKLTWDSPFDVIIGTPACHTIKNTTIGQRCQRFRDAISAGTIRNSKRSVRQET